MGIMVRVPVSVLIMAAAPADSGAFRGVAHKQHLARKRCSAQPRLGASDQTSELRDRIQKFEVQMDLAFRKMLESVNTIFAMPKYNLWRRYCHTQWTEVLHCDFNMPTMLGLHLH